jgi:hypothetical protein
VEAVQYRGTLDASLSQPKQADGRTLPLRFANATLTLGQTAAGPVTSSSVSTQAAGRRIALALSNGLFTVTPASQLDWFAQLVSPSAALTGTVQLLSGKYQLLPILPDPYAANFSSAVRADAPRGRLELKVAWAAAGDPQLSLNIVTGAGDAGSPEVLPVPRLTPLPDPHTETLHGRFQTFVHDRGFLAFAPDRLRTLRLLDLSTNADQLGGDLSWRGNEAHCGNDPPGRTGSQLGGTVRHRGLPFVRR